MLIFLREAKTSTTQLLSIKRLFIIICRQAILEKIEGLPVQKGTACCHGSASSQRCSLASAVSTASLDVGLGTCPPASVWSSVPRYRNARAVLPTLIPSPHRQSQGDETWFGGTMRMPQEPRHNRRPKLAVSRGGEQTHPTVPLSTTKPLCTSGQSLPLGTVWSCPPPRCSYSPSHSSRCLGRGRETPWSPRGVGVFGPAAAFPNPPPRTAGSWLGVRDTRQRVCHWIYTSTAEGRKAPLPSSPAVKDRHAIKSSLQMLITGDLLS